MLRRRSVEVWWDRSALCWGGEGDRTDKAVRGDGGGLGVGEASYEVERDEKELDGVGHAEGDEVNDLEVQLD